MKWWWEWVLTAVAVVTIVLGVQIRFTNLNLPYWADENAQAEIARGVNPASGRKEIGYVWAQHRERLGELPAFSLMLHYWLKIEDSAAWSRTLPAMVSLVSLIYVYKIGRVLGWRKPAALLMTAAVTIGWPFVHYAEEVRIYALSLLSTWMMIYYGLKFWQVPDNGNWGKLTAAHLVGIWSHYGHWLFIPIIFGVLWWKNKWSGRYLLIMVLTCGFLGWNQLRFHLDGFGVDYVARFKLDYVTGTGEKIKMAIKQNLDLAVYTFGAVPWYKDADYFPQARDVEVGVYYLGLGFLGLIAGVLIISRREGSCWWLPGVGLGYTLLVVNLLSLWGKYPVGPVRMSLFYSPLIVVCGFQAVATALKKFGLLAIIIAGTVIMILINNLTRFYRVPQRHIGIEIRGIREVTFG